jgi:hypothetical protein
MVKNRNIKQMKNIAILLFVVSAVWIASSCKKEAKDPVLDMNSTKSAIITQPVDESITLLEDQADSLITFTWIAADYNQSNVEAIKYLLQMDTAGGGFSIPMELVSTADLSYSITVEVMNSRLKSIGFPAGISNSVEFRVVSFLNNTTEFTNATSEIVSNTFTPYESLSPPPAGPDSLWVPGDYQGWDPASSYNVFSPDQDGKYSGYVYFPPGGTFEFKFTSAPDWDHTNFGPGGGEGILDPGAGFVNLSVPAEGNYFLTADTIGLTWTHELRNFMLVGTFNDWGGSPDAELTWDDANKMWTVTIDLDAAAEFKWRANADWAVNLGIKDPDNGTLEQDGLNIIVENAGNYTINLYLYELVPRYEMIEN